MFARIDVASERHTLARLDTSGTPIGKPAPITEDRYGYDTLLKALGPPPVPIVMKATGHYWKNLFAALTAAGNEVVLLNLFQAHRFQDSSLERTKTNAIDANGLARLGFEKRPPLTRLHDEAAESLRELVRHWDRLRQDFGGRVRQLHWLVDLGFPELTRYVRTLDSMLATCLLAEYPTAHTFACANPKRLAKLRYDGRHLIGDELASQLVDAAKRSIGQHHGPAYTLQSRHIYQDLGLRRWRLVEIENLLDTNKVGKLVITIEGIGPQSAARVIAAVGDSARFRTAAAFATYAGTVPGFKRSGKRTGARAGIGPLGNARLRTALRVPVLSALRRNPWLRAFYERLRAAGKPPKLALIAAMRKLLHAFYSVAKNRVLFQIRTE